MLRNTCVIEHILTYVLASGQCKYCTLSGIQNIQMSIPIWVFFIIFCPASISGHASLIEPPSRAAMNLYGFPENPADYQHNEGFCGGFAYQYSSQIGGK